MEQTKQKESEVTSELRRIAEENGGLLRPADVVGAARFEESPLHSWFEWNDDAAAEQYRLWQARQIIRVNVTYLQTMGKSVPYRVFVSLSSDRTAAGGYRVTTDVFRDDAARAVMLADALRELRAIQFKYRNLRELERVFIEIEKVPAA